MHPAGRYHTGMQSDLDTAPSSSALDARLLLFGRDPTPGIVSVSAGRDGRATIWRRVPETSPSVDAETTAASPGLPLSRAAEESLGGGGRSVGEGASQIVVEEDRFPSWLFLADASILAPLKPEHL